MKIILLTAITALLFSLQSFAEGSGHSHGKHQDQTSHGAEMTNDNHKGHKDEGKEMNLDGKIIGLTCLIKHGSIGKTHKSCAKECAEKGLPIGLISDGKIYQISGVGHKSLVEAYKPLLKYLESPVKVKGKIYNRNGLTMLVIEKIKKG